MSKRIIWFLLFVLLVSLSYALCPEVEADCTAQFNNAPTASNLANINNPTIMDFKSMVPEQQKAYLLLEGKYRADFAVEYIDKADFSSEDDLKIGRLFFSEKIGNVNDNKDSFKKFAEKEYEIKFKEIEGEFENLDMKTGKVKTKGSKGCEFNLDEIANSGIENIIVKSDGSLVFDKKGKEYVLKNGVMEKIDNKLTINAGEFEAFGYKHKIPADCETCLITLQDGEKYSIKGENFELGNGDVLVKGTVLFEGNKLVEFGEKTSYNLKGLGEFSTKTKLSVTYNDYLIGGGDINIDEKAKVFGVAVRGGNSFSLDVDNNPKYSLIIPQLRGGELTLKQGDKIIKGFPDGDFGGNNQAFEGVDVILRKDYDFGEKRFYTISQQGSGLCTGISVESKECNFFVQSYYAPEIKLIEKEGKLKIVGKDLKKYGQYLPTIREELEKLMDQEEKKVEGKYKRAIKKIIFVDDEKFAKDCKVSPASYDGCAGGGIITLKESGLNDGTFTHESGHLWRFASGSGILRDIKMPSKNAIGRSVIEMHCVSGRCVKVYEREGKYYTKLRQWSTDEIYESVLGNKGELKLTHVWEDSLIDRGVEADRIFEHEGVFSLSLKDTYFTDDNYGGPDGEVSHYPSHKTGVLLMMYDRDRTAPGYGYSIDSTKLATTIQETGIPSAYGATDPEEAVAELVTEVRLRPEKLSYFLKEDGSYFSPKLVDNIKSLHRRGAITKQEYDIVMEPYQKSIVK
jgi:hypothetical protein